MLQNAPYMFFKKKQNKTKGLQKKERSLLQRGGVEPETFDM